jgi:hypothetical protein
MAILCKYVNGTYELHTRRKFTSQLSNYQLFQRSYVVGCRNCIRYATFLLVYSRVSRTIFAYHFWNFLRINQRPFLNSVHGEASKHIVCFFGYFTTLWQL